MATFRFNVFGADVSAKKAQLLNEIRPLQRGLTATGVEKKRVDQLCRELERRNPTSKPLASDLLNGQWELLYTTSDVLLGRSRPGLFRPKGPIYQIINAPALRARNVETFPFFAEVTANLEPLSVSKVRVNFDTFKFFGLVPVKAPPTAVGRLDVTYLDDDLRISRGDKGNLFVLTMLNPNVKP